MVQLIKSYQEDIDLLYLKVDREYQIDRTIDAGDILIDVDKNNDLVRVELLQASRVLDVPKDILEDDFDMEVKIRSEGSNVTVDMFFSFENIQRRVHSKTNVQGSISNQDLITEKV